jgi:hypothetical protein
MAGRSSRRLKLSPRLPFPGEVAARYSRPAYRKSTQARDESFGPIADVHYARPSGLTRRVISGWPAIGLLASAATRSRVSCATPTFDGFVLVWGMCLHRDLPWCRGQAVGYGDGMGCFAAMDIRAAA